MSDFRPNAQFPSETPKLKHKPFIICALQRVLLLSTLPCAIPFASQPLEITPFRLTHPFRLAYTPLTGVCGGIGQAGRLADTDSNELSRSRNTFSVLASGAFLGLAAPASHRRRYASERYGSWPTNLGCC